MYITQDIAGRIKRQAKLQGKTIKVMLQDLEMGINAISEFSKGKQLSCISLAKISDYLNCSVDYLLGRVDNPQAHKTGNTVSVGDVSGNSGAIGVGNTVTNSATPLDEHQKLLLDLYNNLSTMEQAKLLVYADTLKGK